MYGALGNILTSTVSSYPCGKRPVARDMTIFVFYVNPQIANIENFDVQVSRVPRLIPSLGRPAASLARAVHSVYTEWSLLSAPCVLCLRNADHGGRGEYAAGE